MSKKELVEYVIITEPNIVNVKHGLTYKTYIKKDNEEPKEIGKWLENLTKVEKERDTYKKQLDEIKEYCENKKRDYDLHFGVGSEFVEVYEEILFIIKEKSDNDEK